MNRPNLRLLPTPALGRPCPVPRRRTDGSAPRPSWPVAFEGLLARGERDEESPEYEQLEAAVDGTLDPVEAELFASRLAGDPVLQREFDELVALRDRLQLCPPPLSPGSVRRRPVRRPDAGSVSPQRRSLLVAAGLGLAAGSRRHGAASPAAAAQPRDRSDPQQRPPSRCSPTVSKAARPASWSN